MIPSPSMLPSARRVSLRYGIAGLVPALLLAAAVSSTRAADSPGVFTLVPAAGQRDVCTDTQLHITFPRPPLASGGSVKIFDAESNALVESIDVTPATPRIPTEAGKPPINMPGRAVKSTTINGTPFSYYSVIINGNEATIFPGGYLSYNKSYYVTVDEGAFKDAQGTSYGGITGNNAWRFTTKAAAPQASTRRLIVAQDSKGDFATIQGAIDFVPIGNVNPITLFIRKGLYQEIVNFNNKHSLTFLGEDRKQTIIDYANNPTFNNNRGMFMVRGANDLVLANLTFRNSNPLGGGQAETIILNGGPASKTLITNCDFYSTQDTIQINGQAYISDSYIEGTVDFIWGSGPCYFENCHITSTRTKGYYTQIRNRGTAHGYVFNHCIFDGTAGITDNVFARILPSAFPDSEVVVLNSTLGSAISPRGWLIDRGETDPRDIRFWEYNSRDLEGKPADVSQRIAGSKVLKMPEDKDTIANYSNPEWVLGGWKPQMAPRIVHQPASVTVKAGEKATLSISAVAVPQPNFQWTKDATDIAGATDSTLTIDKASPEDAGEYACLIIFSSGNVNSASARLTVQR